MSTIVAITCAFFTFDTYQKLLCYYIPFIESFTIAHLRKTYFEIKDRVFGNLRLGVACDTEALEEILKRVFKDRRMTPVPQGTKSVHLVYKH